MTHKVAEDVELGRNWEVDDVHTDVLGGLK
jgi:hypothetical protein